MNLGARSRSVVVVAPILAALLCLATVGVWRPRLIDPGLHLRALLAAVLLAGGGATVVIGSAALRRPAWPRPDRIATALATGLLTASVAGVLLRWPVVLTWGVLRAAVLVALLAALLLGPHFRRDLTDWTLLLLDGWLVAASVFLICWVMLGMTGSPLSTAPPRFHVALYWLPADLIVASVTTGLAMRSADARRTPMLLVTLGSLLAAVADTSWALTGAAQFGAVEAVILLAALGGARVVRPAEVRPQPGTTEGYPPLLRLPQWAVVPGLIAAVVDDHDPIVIGTAVSVVLGLAVELALAGRANHHLWRALNRQAERLDQLLAESRDALVHVDPQGVVRFASEALVDVLGYTPHELVGRNGLDLVHPDDRGPLIEQIRRIEVGGSADTGGDRVIGRFRHADGRWRVVESTVTRRTGAGAGYVLSARDVGKRVTLEEELRRLAGTDTLTALANRHAFLQTLQERLRDGPAAVLFVDLDGFKAINDMDGHAAGDRLLCEVAETLRRELRGRDVAARLGGDEFAVLLDTDQVDEVRAVADRLVQRLRRMPSDPARRTAASIGVAIGRQVSAETLLGDADLAMYEAKARGGRRHVVFERWMRERVTERARMGTALELACRGDGLLLDAQPIVEMADGTWVGFEALTRWQDGETRRQPQEFLPVAEESGLIEPLGRWVIHKAIGWLSSWPDPRAGVSVNVAGSQLATVGFGDWVHQQLATVGVAPARLTLEISERTTLGDLQRATAVLQPLRALGVRISLDDFGTGFSSLGHLTEVRVDELKIDKRFVSGLGRRPQDDALVRAVCRLGGDLGLRVVAEGVETLVQENILLDHGCRLGQGYRYAEPTPIGELRLPDASRRRSPVAPARVPRLPPDDRTVAS